ncbi:MAG: hypothetical protein H7273_07155 [Polaromonas sp.]|nr:hypothetical protein [Polaromonas sp.]
MNRCPLRLAGALFALAALAAALPAAAQTAADTQPAVRTFPAAALRGEMTVSPTPPVITLDGKPDRLSPGARIRGIDNRPVMSGALAGQSAVVNYLREPAGNVHEVWILSSAEIKLKRPNTQASWFSIGSSVDTETPPAILPR